MKTSAGFVNVGTENKAAGIFKKQKEAYRKQPYISYEDRMDILKKIASIIEENE